MIAPERIFDVESDEQFAAQCLDVFRFQAENNPVYRNFIGFLGKDVNAVQSPDQIPFFPIEFFKTHSITSKMGDPEIIFTSSGTTGMQQSRHIVMDLSLYEQSFHKAFERYYGKPENMAILALLPSYLEREGSSLIYMVDALIAQSKQEESGYFLYNHHELFEKLQALHRKNTPTLLIGVTYALLDFVEAYPQLNFPQLIVMETGGMKGRRKEMIREEVHAQLTSAFGVEKIHSEYGMTELLSQAYSNGDGLFTCPPWMRVLIRDTNDPLSYLPKGQTGGINVIDLANVYSCSFIATQDLGKIHLSGEFEVLGRFDHSDIRGCNLLVV